MGVEDSLTSLRTMGIKLSAAGDGGQKCCRAYQKRDSVGGQTKGAGQPKLPQAESWPKAYQVSPNQLPPDMVQTAQTLTKANQFEHNLLSI